MALSDLPKMILRLPLPNIRLAPSPYQVHWPTPPTSFEEAIELARTCPRKPIRNSEPSVSPTAVQLETHDIDAGVSTKNQIYNALYSGPLADMQSSGEDYAQDIRRCSAESLAGPEIPEAASPSPNLGSSARQASASPRNERYHPYPAPNSIEAEQSVARSPRVKTKSESSRAANFKDGDRDVPQNPKYASIHPQLNRSDGESARDAGVPQSLKLVGQLDPLGARWTPEALAVADEVHLNIGSRPFVVLEPYLRRCRVLALRLFPSRLGGLGVCINESQVLFVKHLFDSQDLLKCHPSNVALLLLILAHGHSTFGDSQSLLYQYTFKEYKGKAEALKDYLIKGAETLLNVTDWSRNDMTAMQAVVLLGLHHFNDKDAWSGFQPRLKRAIDACRSRMESRGMSYRDPLSDTSEFTARSKAQEITRRTWFSLLILDSHNKPQNQIIRHSVHDWSLPLDICYQSFQAGKLISSALQRPGDAGLLILNSRVTTIKRALLYVASMVDGHINTAPGSDLWRSAVERCTAALETLSDELDHSIPQLDDIRLELINISQNEVLHVPHVEVTLIIIHKVHEIAFIAQR